MLHHAGTRTIETERLILRRYQASDAVDMFENWVTDSEVTRFWGWSPHTDINQTKSLLSVWIDEYDSLTTYHWVVVYKKTNQAAGYIYLNSIDEENRAAAVHYLVSRKLWGRGIATEACKAVIGYAFGTIGFLKVYSYHHIENPASGRVMQKAGMRFVKEEIKEFPPGDEDLNGLYRYYEIDSYSRIR